MSPLSWRQYYWSLMIARALLTYLIFIDVAYNAKLLNFSTIDAAFGKSHHHQENQQASPPSPSNNSRRSLRSVYLALNDNNNNNNYSNNNSNSNRNINSNSNENNNLYLSDQPAVLDQCCACDEAKYELVFEGLWSRYTHPEDFPENYWLAHFSDIIGASHSNEFRMWNHDTLATEGVRELAETGSTKKLESELKQVSSKTRTIIKARELRYPLLNGKTSAVFRTDRQHHLVSILSKLNPSPDWILGVSGLELCQLDCSWASQRVVNLYLWDAGTDSGTTFTAPDTPTRPQEPIHPYRKESSKSNSSTTAAAVPSVSSTMDGDQTTADSPPPIDQTGRSYLADSFVVNPAPASGGEMEQHSSSLTTTSSKPYARLTITRQRIYEKSCNTNGEPATRKNGPIATAHSSSSLSNVNPIEWAETTATSVTDCRYTDWSDWSSCSSNCGRGIRTRTRSFVDEQAHLAGCSQTNLIEKEICLSECIGGNLTCVTRDWSEWSRCSVTCGQGIRKRTRSPIGPMRKACGRIELSQTEACSASHNVDCSSAPADTNGCEVSEWSQWSRCSVACGKGTRIRTRQYLQKQTAATDCNATLIQKSSCTGRLETCQDSKANGAHGKTAITTAVPHNPNLPVIDCKLSPWSPWSTCSALCGEARRTRSRYIVQMPQNGGKACDKKLSRTQKCKDLPPCPPNYPIAETTAPVASRPTN